MSARKAIAVESPKRKKPYILYAGAIAGFSFAIVSVASLKTKKAEQPVYR
jgi:hypothetical protein